MLLHEEARLLESARIALEQGALERTERELKQYAASYAHPKLLPEALALELELRPVVALCRRPDLLVDPLEVQHREH